MKLENLKAIAEKLPESVKTKALDLIERMGEVVEGIGDEPIGWEPSRLKLVQGTTDRTSIPKGTAIGDFVLGEVKVDQPLEFIPLRIWEGRQMWSPDQNEAKLLCSSPDAKLGYIGNYCNQCPHAKFDEEARKSECGKTQNVIAIRADLSDIFVASFGKTNYQTGLSLKSAATKAKVPLYRRIYALTSETNKQYKNVENYALETLEGDKKIVPAEFVDFLKALFDEVTEDRKTSVDKFHELVLSRKSENPQLAGPAETNTVLLTDESEPAQESVSSLAKNYSV